MSHTSVLRSYFERPLRWPGLFCGLIGVHVYQLLSTTTAYPHEFSIVLLLSVAGLLALLNRTRREVFGVFAAALLAYLIISTQLVATGPLDEQSTRDEAVGHGAWALLRGENPWRVQIGTDVTTGPTSILLAVPFVLVFGDVNWMAFLFWTCLFGLLFRNDLVRQGETWVVFALLLMLGALDLRHTLYWSLDELYYPMLYLAFAFLFAERRAWTWVAALLTAAALTRSSYVFPVAGFAMWCMSRGALGRSDLVRVVSGAAAAAAIILVPFVLVSGSDLRLANPWRTALAFSGAAWPESNPIFHALNQITAAVGHAPMQALKIAAALGMLAAVAWQLSRLRIVHPFWHITAGSIVAHTFVWMPTTLASDYTLMLVLPAMLAVSLHARPVLDSTVA